MGYLELTSKQILARPERAADELEASTAFFASAAAFFWGRTFGRQRERRRLAEEMRRTQERCRC